MVIAAVATHFTARASVARQRGLPGVLPPTVVMNMLLLWALPLGVLVGGSFLPVAILVYWLSNNAWTLAQQHCVHRALDREEAAEGSAAINAQPRPAVDPPDDRR